MTSERFSPAGQDFSSVEVPAPVGSIRGPVLVLSITVLLVAVMLQGWVVAAGIAIVIAIDRNPRLPGW